MTRALLRSLLAVVAVAAAGVAVEVHAQTIAVVHARALVDANAEPVQDAVIVVRDGKIVAAGAVAVPKGARIVDAKGQLVTTGLMNAGTQLGLVEINAIADTSDPAVTTGPLGPAFDVQYALNPNSVLLPRARADGLTRAGVYPGGSAIAPFDGQGAVLRLSEGPELLDRPKAMMFAEIGGMAAVKSGGSRSAEWILLRNALDEAAEHARTHHSLAPRDQLLNHLDVVALRPVIAGRMPLALLASRESDIRQAIRIAIDYKVRVVIFGGQEAWRVAPELAAHHIAVVLNPFDNLPATFDQIGARLDNAAILDRAGVEIAFSVPGIHFSHDAGSALREAAGLAVANGLSRGAALKALIVNPADIWGVADHYGAMTPGKDADLVIWDGDPLEPGSAPVMVMVRGQQVSLVTRQSALAARYAPSHRNDPTPPGYR